MWDFCFPIFRQPGTGTCSLIYCTVAESLFWIYKNKLHYKFGALSVLALYHLLLVKLNWVNIALLGRENSVKEVYKHTANNCLFKLFITSKFYITYANTSCVSVAWISHSSWHNFPEYVSKQFCWQDWLSKTWAKAFFKEANEQEGKIEVIILGVCTGS